MITHNQKRASVRFGLAALILGVALYDISQANLIKHLLGIRDLDIPGVVIAVTLAFWSLIPFLNGLQIWCGFTLEAIKTVKHDGAFKESKLLRAFCRMPYWMLLGAIAGLVMIYCKGRAIYVSEYIGISTSLLAVGSGIVAAFATFTRYVIYNRNFVKSNICLSCGYPKPQQATVCPECGKPFAKPTSI